MGVRGQEGVWLQCCHNASPKINKATRCKQNPRSASGRWRITFSRSPVLLGEHQEKHSLTTLSLHREVVNELSGQERLVNSSPSFPLLCVFRAPLCRRRRDTVAGSQRSAGFVRAR